ncbi:hypothetical protein MTO96_033015, partial [Rhipicephalus appendiculatus]
MASTDLHARRRSCIASLTAKPGESATAKASASAPAGIVPDVRTTGVLFHGSRRSSLTRPKNETHAWSEGLAHEKRPAGDCTCNRQTAVRRRTLRLVPVAHRAKRLNPRPPLPALGRRARQRPRRLGRQTEDTRPRRQQRLPSTWSPCPVQPGAERQSGN